MRGTAIGIGLSQQTGPASAPETALSTAPASVTRAVFTDHMVFNGSDQLTGFTLDLFGNSPSTIKVGSPLKGPDGGYLMSEATSTLHYCYSIFSEVNESAPTGAHVALCYKRTPVADNAGVFVGSSNVLTFAGAAGDGVDRASTAANGSLTNYRGRDLSGVNRTFSGASNQDTVHDNFYRYTGSPTVRSICFQDLRMAQDSGRCYWGRFDPSDTTYHCEIQVLGWAVCTDANDIEAMNDWLIQWAPAA